MENILLGPHSFYRAGNCSITENLWKSDPRVIILYRIVTRGSLYPRVNILYDTGIISCDIQAGNVKGSPEILSQENVNL